jgi:hypothetical protein
MTTGAKAKDDPRERQWIQLSHDYSANLEGLSGLLDQFDFLLSGYCQSSQDTDLRLDPSDALVRAKAGKVIEEAKRQTGNLNAIGLGNQIAESVALLKQGLSAKVPNLTSLWQGATTLWDVAKAARTKQVKVPDLEAGAMEFCALMCRLVIAQQKPRIFRNHADALAFRTGELQPEDELPSLDLREIVRDAITATVPFATQQGIEIRQVLVPNVPVLVAADSASLVRAFRALLDNAIKYNWQTRTGLGWVDVRIQMSFRATMVQIVNWGTPIDPYEIESGAIFRRGYRGRYAEREEVPGTGTGLSYAKGIIEEVHLGQLLVETRVDKKSPSKDLGYPNITTVTVQLQRVG